MNYHQVRVSTDIERLDSSVPDVVMRLLDEARGAARKAYAPYSHFKVGAALLLNNGEIFAASNQENAAYPSGLCAERVTLFYANARYPEAKVLKLLIYAETDSGAVRQPVTPCGACRQVLVEKETTQGQPIEIYLAGANDIYSICSSVALMPLSFVPDSLEG